MNKNSVDVIMPTRARNTTWILDSLASIAVQENLNSIIIVADNAPDFNFIKSIKLFEKHLKIILLRNQGWGVGDALNTGLSCSKAEFIARCDDDDTNVIERFREQVDFLTQNREYKGVFSQMSNLLDGTLLSRPTGPLWNPILLTRCLPPHPTLMIRREALTGVGGYPSGFKAEDFALWLTSAKELKYFIMEKPFVNYRIHENQTSNSWNNTSIHSPLYFFWRNLGRTLNINSHFLNKNIFNTIFCDQENVEEIELFFDYLILKLNKIISEKKINHEYLNLLTQQKMEIVK